MSFSDPVRAYYDNNTRTFLRFGGPGAVTGGLHRSLRMPGVQTAAEAVEAIHHVLLAQLAEWIPASPSAGLRAVVADLGCGVGATMEWLVARTELQMVGITLSGRQSRMAGRRLGGRAPVVVGDFASDQDLQRMTGGCLLDAAYMIESFVHAADAEQFLQVIGRRMSAQGVLVICDDFPSRRLLRGLAAGNDDPERASRSQRLNSRLASEFQWGWHIHGFHTTDAVAAMGARTGWELVRAIDLSRFVITNRPRDLAARIAAVPARVCGADTSWWRNVIGGAALQRLIRRRLTKYRVLVLRRAVGTPVQ